MENKVYTFQDLKFEPRSLTRNIGAKLKFENGFEVSVIAGPSAYGDGKETFEIAAFDPSGNFIRLGVNDDVLGWQSPEEINVIMAEIQKFGSAAKG